MRLTDRQTGVAWKVGYCTWRGSWARRQSFWSPLQPSPVAMSFGWWQRITYSDHRRCFLLRTRSSEKSLCFFLLKGVSWGASHLWSGYLLCLFHLMLCGHVPQVKDPGVDSRASGEITYLSHLFCGKPSDLPEGNGKALGELLDYPAATMSFISSCSGICTWTKCRHRFVCITLVELVWGQNLSFAKARSKVYHRYSGDICPTWCSPVPPTATQTSSPVTELHAWFV